MEEWIHFVEEVQSLVRELPEAYVEVLRLRVVEGLPVAKVAEQMERSQGSIRMLTLRALERLRAECVL